MTMPKRIASIGAACSPFFLFNVWPAGAIPTVCRNGWNRWSPFRTALGRGFLRLREPP